MNIQETAQFRAVAGSLQGVGNTPQSALGALLERLTDDAPTPIVIWPYNRGDAFFSTEQHARMEELKRRRATLSAVERAELEQLVEDAFDATISRTQAVQIGK